MIKYADPQLTSNLLAILVTVISPLEPEHKLIQHCPSIQWPDGPNSLHPDAYSAIL